MNVNGIPLHKEQKILFGKDAKLGNETLGRNIHHLCQDSFKPMQAALIETMNKQHALLADKTTIKVLQSQGKGACEPAEHTRQTDYLASVCSASYESKRRVVFSNLGGRGNEAIVENLTAYRSEVLVTDAYAAYDSYCEKAGIKHQCCLVHLKRELLDAVDIDSLVKAFKCRSPEQAIERAVKEINNDDSIYHICCVIKGISKIYRYERMIKRQDYGNNDEYFEAVLKNRRRHAKGLMDGINAVMLALSERYAKVQGGKYVKGSRNDQLSKAVTYYMNHRENFRLFLDDGKIPLDVNAVESSIRVVAVLRKACDHKQSVEYTESLFTLMSLTETAKANDIDNVIEWLTEYSKAYYLHRASNTLTYEVNKNKRSMDSKMMALMRALRKASIWVRGCLGITRRDPRPRPPNDNVLRYPIKRSARKTQRLWCSLKIGNGQDGWLASHPEKGFALSALRRIHPRFIQTLKNTSWIVDPQPFRRNLKLEACR